MDTSTDSLRDSLESAITDVETPVEVAAEPTETVPEPTQSERARDEQGRFAKAEQQEITEPEAETPAEIQQRLSPKSWRKEIAEKYWNNLDPELQAEIERREADVNKGFESYRPKAQMAEAFQQALEPYMPTLQALGTHPAEAAARLFNVEHTLRFGSPDQKIGMVQTIMREYGIDPDAVYTYEAPQVDPQLQQMQAYVRQLEQQYNQVMTAQQEREQAQLSSEIAQFAEGKEHFDAVREDMAALLQAGRATDLQSAYDMAVYANPETRKAMLQQQTLTQQAHNQQKRATSAAVSVKGSSPVSGGATAPKSSLRDELSAALSNLM